MRIETPKIGQGIYASTDVSQILCVAPSKASYLIRRYTKDRFKNIANHQYEFGQHFNTINFYALIELKVFDVLRKHGLSAQRILKAYRYYSDTYNTDYPFAKKQVLFSGKDIIAEKGEQYLVTADGKEVPFLYDIIRPFTQKIEFDDNQMALRLYPMGKGRGIVVDPMHQFGAPIIEGTNIKASTLYSHYLGGDNIEFIAKLFSLQVRQVEEAIEFNERQIVQAA